MKKSNIQSNNKITVRYFQRKPRKGFNFSLEYIFYDVRERLKSKIVAEIKTSSFYNTGIFSKVGNSIEAAFRQGRNVNHITGEVHFLNLLMKKKTVLLTVLDCGFMHRKKGISKYFTQLIYLKLPEKRSEVITAISLATKKEIIKYTGCKPEKIHVVPVAVADMYKPDPKIFSVNDPVILQIGTGPNKNINRLAEALKGLKCSLIIIGKLSEDQKKILNTNQITYTNYYNLSNAQVIEQYKACDIVSFVSTFEGFGMPIVEANCVERVVITSNISSMPEIASDAACLVNPYDVKDIRDGIVKLISDHAYREKLIENGRKNKLRFNGEIIADQYYQLYKKIAANL